MTRYAIATLLAVALAMTSAGEVQAQQPVPFGYGFQPFGFYQPYGVRYRSRTPTPPYFALNPPVYYGARHARPYGMSPFAAPPMVAPSETFKGRLRSDFNEGTWREGQPRRAAGCQTCNPYIHVSSAKKATSAPISKGKVRRNPFVDKAEQLVAK